MLFRSIVSFINTTEDPSVERILIPDMALCAAEYFAVQKNEKVLVLLTDMTEWELCELFGVIAPTIRAGIKALCKSGVLREYETKHTIKLSDKRSMEVYSLEAIIALAFRINTFGAEQVRRAILERLYLRKEKTGIFFSLNITDTANPKYFA